MIKSWINFQTNVELTRLIINATSYASKHTKLQLKVFWNFIWPDPSTIALTLNGNLYRKQQNYHLHHIPILSHSSILFSPLSNIHRLDLCDDYFAYKKFFCISTIILKTEIQASLPNNSNGVHFCYHYLLLSCAERASPSGIACRHYGPGPFHLSFFGTTIKIILLNNFYNFLLFTTTLKSWQQIQLKAGVLKAVQIADPVHRLSHDSHFSQSLSGSPSRSRGQRL